jgi:ketol-acid reductoisomerase
MASIASRSASALRAASRRAPRAGAKIAAKPAQTASYSLLARQAASSSRKPTLQVKIFISQVTD